MSSPPIETGVEEPMFVCGAIASTSAAIADHRSGGVGARAGRRDVDDDRHLGREDPLDDRAHRRAETARRVHLDHDRRVALAARPLDRVEQVVLRDRVDVVLELGDQDAARRLAVEAGAASEEGAAAAASPSTCNPRNGACFTAPSESTQSTL